MAALKLTKLFGINDFLGSKDSGKVLIIIIYCYLIIIIIIISTSFLPSPLAVLTETKLCRQQSETIQAAPLHLC